MTVDTDPQPTEVEKLRDEFKQQFDALKESLQAENEQLKSKNEELIKHNQDLQRALIRSTTTPATEEELAHKSEDQIYEERISVIADRVLEQIRI